jgi:hypothetical protein
MEGFSQAHEVTRLRAITRTLSIRPWRRTGVRSLQLSTSIVSEFEYYRVLQDGHTGCVD